MKTLIITLLVIVFAATQVVAHEIPTGPKVTVAVYCGRFVPDVGSITLPKADIHVAHWEDDRIEKVAKDLARAGYVMSLFWRVGDWNMTVYVKK